MFSNFSLRSFVFSLHFLELFFFVKCEDKHDTKSSLYFRIMWRAKIEEKKINMK